MFKTKIKKFFNTIEYCPASDIVREELNLKFVNACCRCIDIYDVHFLFKKFKYILNKITRINRLIALKSKKNHDWLTPDDSYNIELIEEEYAEGVSIFTTAFFNKKNRVNFLSYNESGIYDVTKEKNTFRIYEENEYILKGKYNSMSIIHKNSKEPFITMKMKDNYELVVKNNNSQYEIVYKDGFYRVINKLVKNTGNDEDLSALINTDILSANSIYATCMVDCYDEDIELINYLGLAILLLLQNKIIEFRNKMAFLSFRMFPG